MGTGHGSCPSSHPLLQSEAAGQRQQGTREGLGSGPKPRRRWRGALRPEKRSPRGERRAPQPSGPCRTWGRGYLQVRADSPQDIVDAVAGDEGHEDVLQEKEKLLGKFLPIPRAVFHRQGTGRDVLPLNLPSSRNRIPPSGISQRSFPALIFAAC